MFDDSIFGAYFTVSGPVSSPRQFNAAMHHSSIGLGRATAHSGLLQALCRSVNHRRGGDAEMRIKILGRGAGAEAGHADEDAIRPDHRVPAEPDRGFDRNLDRGFADDRLALRVRL